MKIIAVLISLSTLLTCAATAQGQLILAEDFLYSQPTKSFGAGGGFTRQDYGGGQHTELGQWEGRWNSFGDGVITGSDISGEAFVETFIAETDAFAGVTRNGLSDNWLDRDFSFSGLENEQTLFFGITMRSSDEFAAPNATFSINDARGSAQIAMGFSEGGFRAILGNPDDVENPTGDFDIIPGPELTDGFDPHRLIGKIEFNASGDDERLTVWLDPTDVETAEETALIEADIIGGLSEFAGNLRLDHSASVALMFWDDLALGTTWESVAEVNVPRLTLRTDTDTNEVRWLNETGVDLDVTYLQVESESGFLDTRWESLTDQGVPGFAENNPDTNLLTESNLSGELSLASDQSVTWGRIYRRGEDLVARVGTDDGLLNVANVEYGEFPATEIDTDFDDDGTTGVADIDALCNTVAAGTNAASFDLNGDGNVDAADVASFLSQSGSLAGDTNLDSAVNFTDFLVLSDNFGQSDHTWSGGDFDCNGMVAFADFLALSDNFGQTAGAEAASVPEPNGSVLAFLALLGVVSLRRRLNVA